MNKNKIWIDETLLEYITVDKHKTEDNGYIIAIEFKDVSCISFISKLSSMFTSDNLYIVINEKSMEFSCVNGDPMNFKMLSLQNDIYILDSTYLMNEALFQGASRSVTIYADFNTGKDKLIPLYNEDDIVEE